MVEFISNLRDVSILKLKISQGSVLIEIEDLDSQISVLQIYTEVLQYNPSELSSMRVLGTKGVVFDLKKELGVFSGLYQPVDDIPTLSFHSRVGLSLAYGKKASEFNYLIYLSSSVPLFSCLVKRDEQVLISIKN